MGDLGRRLARLEQQMGDSDGPTWMEMVAATRRLGQHTRRELNAQFFGLPRPTVAEDEQAAQARAVVAAWDRRHWTEPELVTPTVRERIARRVREQIEIIGEPWPTD